LPHNAEAQARSRPGHNSLFLAKGAKNRLQVLARPTVKNPHHSQAAAFSALAPTPDTSAKIVRQRSP
jgi:hypothetical protein